MVLYICKFCDYKTDRVSNVISHLSKKKKCSELNILKEGEKIELGIHYEYINDNRNVNLNIINGKFQCVNCNKIYSYKSSFYRHSKICLKSDENPDDEKEEIKPTNINTNCNNTTTNNTTNTNNNTNTINSNNTINIQNNVTMNLLHYGKENLSYIDKRTIEELIKEYRKFKNDADIIKNFTNIVHFNEEHPENHNIRVLHKNENKELLLKIFMPPSGKTVNPHEGVWEILNHKDLAERMAGEKIDQLDEHSQRCKLSIVCHELLNEYLDKFSYMRTKSLEQSLEHLLLSKQEPVKQKPLRKPRRSSPYICEPKDNTKDKVI